MIIGQRVKITCSKDETFDAVFIGMEGTIIHADIGDGRCPVGQSKKDPFYTVLFDDDSTGSFWKEEMKVSD